LIAKIGCIVDSLVTICVNDLTDGMRWCNGFVLQANWPGDKFFFFIIFFLTSRDKVQFKRIVGSTLFETLRYICQGDGERLQCRKWVLKVQGVGVAVDPAELHDLEERKSEILLQKVWPN
jgi:hypothetical protein